MAASTAAMIGVRGHAKRATQWKDEEQTTGRVMSQKRLDFRRVEWARHNSIDKPSRKRK